MKKNNKIFNKIFSTIKKISKNVNELQLCMLAFNVIKYSKKIARGLMTEAEAMNLLTVSAKGIIITDSIYIISSLLLWAVEEYQKMEKRRKEKRAEEAANKEEEEDPEVDDLDDEPEIVVEKADEEDSTEEPDLEPAPAT